MIYRSSSLLSKNDNASYSIAEMARTPETYLECLLQLNEDCQKAENEYNIAYYRSLKESALNESSDMVLSEGLIGKAVEMISKIIEAIINFIRNIIARLRGSKTKAYAAQAKAAYNARKSGANANNDQSTSPNNSREDSTSKQTSWADFTQTKGVFTYWHFADWNALDSSIVLQGCQLLITHVEDICKGESVAAPSPSDLITALKGMGAKIMKAAIVPEPAERATMDFTNGSEFIKFCETNVIFKETREVTVAEFVKAYEGPCIFERAGWYNEKLISDINKKLDELKSVVKRANTGITPENIKYAQQYLNYFKECTIAWSNFVTRNERAHEAATNYFAQRMVGTVNESGMIHGENFDSSTLFANGDLRDFNRTEWLDLELTAEAFCFNQVVNEARRSMAVQEAIIWSENRIPSETFRKLQAMQEAEMNKLANAISEIIKRVKEFVTKFINDLQDKHGPNAAFMKRHAELIKNPFKIESVTSTGNILDGIIRMQDVARQPAFNPTTMNEEDKASMFKAHFLAGFASKANGGKRPVKWEDGITISDYCKAFYGASMPADQYPPITYNKQELEAAKANILKFMEAPHAFFSKIKQELSELEKEAKKAGAEAAKPNATVNNATQSPNSDNKQSDSGQANANNASNNEVQHNSAFYSVLYERWFTEMEIAKDPADDNESKSGTGDGNKKQNNSKVYIECLKDILLAKLTAARFIYSECNQLIRAHAKSYMSKEQAAAEAKTENNANASANQSNPQLTSSTNS